MAKKLLREFYSLNYDQKMLQESRDKNNGRICLAGVFQEADTLNQNHRKYPRDLLEREVENYNNTAIRGGWSIGEIDHPDSSVVNLKNASHKVIALWWDDNKVMGKLEVLDTPAGKILQDLLCGGVNLGISSRSVGDTESIREGNEEFDKVTNMELICFDAVSQPSVKSAFLSLSESKLVTENKIGSKEQRIYRIASRILEK